MNGPHTNNLTWHILDAGSIWVKEFAAAFTAQAPTIAWVPEFSLAGAFQNWQRTEQLTHPELEIIRFPLQRGYARFPIRSLLPYQNRLIKRLLAHGTKPEDGVLVCTTPFYVPVAECWPGPVVYYMTDLTAGYEGINARQVEELDRRFSQAATIVCPNSRRIADYMVSRAGCDPNKITVVPNATRQSNVAEYPLLTPGALPTDIASISRPIAGVIGNLSANMDWQLLQDIIPNTPYLTWVFVGPTTMPIADPAQRKAREKVMKMSTAKFVGSKPYGELQAYARCFDVAVLPYCKKEPTYSGSSTRFYEHLTACRPMVATRGFAELLEKEPLLKLVNTAGEMKEELELLRAQDFSDGEETNRWLASKTGTWEYRAQTMQRALDNALSRSDKSLAWSKANP
jgi:hypothetical protein